MLVDANVLLYALLKNFPQHVRMREWLTLQLAQNQRIAVPWASVLAFMRIATNRRVLAVPLTSQQALQAMTALIAHPNVWIAWPTPDHLRVFLELCDRHAAVGNVVMDLDIAALAMEHGLRVVSVDTDFARFPESRWLDPLAT